jgi:hypothetical protein
MNHCLVNHNWSHRVCSCLYRVSYAVSCNYNPASCKICTVIHFIHAKNMSAVEIHCELSSVYNQNIISEGTIRQWCRMFKDGRTNVHNEEWCGWPSVLSDDDLVQTADQKICSVLYYCGCTTDLWSTVSFISVVNYIKPFHKKKTVNRNT